ncbi:hypothetical protein DICPUDRAFT_151026 [Dictyostelium purpureum]|uniref:Tubby C-terminal domain-containing protein n=1 Tax=Dictyostelium purpureum TaxID=5786 RepID=F0ZHU0_DICPU|nr:uncharacterized protein DICPUDRAFT_151026 [Dictyostelium purpureum]EGC36469.1 hypothetical protein DICPUDRAFT_151026 [Dictyostelium purpureum]|eukprot:XP_003286982.1 hypothetical protein DICPUDRAFT_151026 [Dictyostelium purpureum]
MYDATTDKLIYYIKENVKWSLHRAYEIFDDQKQLVCTVKSTSLLKAKFDIEMNGLDSNGEAEKYEVKGNFSALHFELLNDKLQIGKVEKKIVWWGEAYILDIHDSFNPALFTAMVVIIDSFIGGNKNSGFGNGI